MKILQYEEFRNYILEGRQKPTLEEYKTKLIKNDLGQNQFIQNWLDSLPDYDVRKSSNFVKNLYEFLYDNDYEFLKLWFDSHLSVQSVNEYIYFEPLKDIVSNRDIDGRYQISSGRLMRNLFWKQIYEEIEKPNTPGFPSTINCIKALYNFEINSRIFTNPSTQKTFEEKNYEDVFALLRTATIKCSIFNPYTYHFIVKNILSQGENFLCPVMSWGSPVIALENTNYKNFVGVDVIPAVIDTSKSLANYINENKNDFFAESKNFQFYCNPSETLETETDFLDKYTNFFDTVFFSPPYYDLEMYQSGNEQSWKNHKTYEEWLKGYWEETVKLCKQVLKPGATFSFVIVPEYASFKDGRTIPISKDMHEIAAKYFTKTDHYYINWGGFSAMKNAAEKRKNVREDLHIYRNV